MISENIQATQQILRSRVLQLMRALSPQQRSVQSQQIRSHVFDWLTQLFQNVPSHSVDACLGVFSPLSDEPDLASLYKDLNENWPSLRIAFPKVHSNGELRFFLASKFVPSPWGLLEPDATDLGTHEVVDLDLLLVPGVVFHPEGARIGRGKGYYDKYLLNNSTVVSCGVCFRDQLVLEHWVENPHDRRMNYIISPESIFVCSERN